MTDLLWNQIPFVTSPSQDDELLLVNGSEQSRRIKQKDYIYRQLAELAWVASGTQNEGIGTANVWGGIPFNNLSGPDWISLNADGSFALEEGIYFFDFIFQISLGNQTRFRLFNLSDSSTLIFRSVFHSAVTMQNDLILRKRVSIGSPKNLAIQVNVASTAYNYGIYYSVDALSGFNPTIAQGFIWKLG